MYVLFSLTEFECWPVEFAECMCNGRNDANSSLSLVYVVQISVIKILHGRVFLSQFLFELKSRNLLWSGGSSKYCVQFSATKLTECPCSVLCYRRSVQLCT
jgi:hypothetical protein